MPAFQLPEIEENAEGWGPISAPPQFDGVPFMPFSKGERLGRIADFGAQAGRGMFMGGNRYRDREPAPGSSVFIYEKTEEVRRRRRSCSHGGSSNRLGAGLNHASTPAFFAPPTTIPPAPRLGIFL